MTVMLLLCTYINVFVQYLEAKSLACSDDYRINYIDIGALRMRSCLSPAPIEFIEYKRAHLDSDEIDSRFRTSL